LNIFFLANVLACVITLVSPCLRAFTFLGPALASIANFLGGFDGFAYGAILVLACESSQFSEQSLKKYSMGCYFSFGFACLQFGLALLGTYIVSWFLHRYIELPFLKLKNKNTILFETAIHPQY